MFVQIFFLNRPEIPLRISSFLVFHPIFENNHRKFRAMATAVEKNNFDPFPDLEPVDTSSLVDKVEIKLIRYFLDNDLKPGDAIPKELTLADSLGVSRTVIREALLRLRMTGLIVSQKTRESVLANPDLI